MRGTEGSGRRPKPVSRLAAWFAADGGIDLDPDLSFVPEMQLCDLLHCLPSELDQETVEDVNRLHIHFAAKALWEKREQAKQEQQNRVASKGGQYGG